MASLPGLHAFALVALTFGGCATSRTGDATPDPPLVEPRPTGSVRLGVGEIVRVGTREVRFEGVEEDSRCPQGVACVWEGRARVRLTVAGAPAVLTVPHGGPASADEPQAATQNSVSVRVLALHPYPGTPEAEAGAPVEVEIVAAEMGDGPSSNR